MEVQGIDPTCAILQRDSKPFRFIYRIFIIMFLKRKQGSYRTS